MTFEISVGISLFSLLSFPEHGDIQNVSYTAQRQTDLSLKKFFLSSYGQRSPMVRNTQCDLP